MNAESRTQFSANFNRVDRAAVVNSRSRFLSLLRERLQLPTVNEDMMRSVAAVGASDIAKA